MRRICHGRGVVATVFEVDVKDRCTVAPGFRPVLFALLFAMALSAYMPAPVCAQPGGTGKAADPAKAYEIDPGPDP
jgi:hypothetical protein